MLRMNRTVTLASVPLIVLPAATCTRYQGPRGPAAAALFELYGGDWVLDADASDPAPWGLAGSIRLRSVTLTGRGSGGPTLGPQPCPRGRICIDRPESSGDKAPESAPDPDSALRHVRGELALYRASQLTLQFTSSFVRVSPTGLGAPLEVPTDSRKMEIDHEFGGFPIKAWAEWRGESLRLTISPGDDRSWIADTYELPGDGTLVVTRELGGGSSFLGTTGPPRLVYRRP